MNRYWKIAGIVGFWLILAGIRITFELFLKVAIITFEHPISVDQIEQMERFLLAILSCICTGAVLLGITIVHIMCKEFLD